MTKDRQQQHGYRFRPDLFGILQEALLYVEEDYFTAFRTGLGQV